LNTNKLRLLFGALLLQQLAGCATYTSALDPGTKTDPEAGYVYGRFKIGRPDSGGLLPARLRAGLVINEKNGANSYAIQFELEGVPSAIAIKPGTYVIKKLTFATGDYLQSGEKIFPEGPLTTLFTVESGKAYYLADFVVATKISSTGSSRTFSWQLTSVTDNYISTTAELKKTLPQLESITTLRAIAK